MGERPDFPTTLDSTARKQFVSCPMSFYYNTLLHLRPKEVSIHLHYGSCFARGLELFRIAFYGKGVAITEALAIGYEGILKEWGDFEYQPHHKNKTLENCLISLYEYFMQYPPSTDPVQPLMTDLGPAVEFTFALPIPGTKHPQTGEPILYTGRFDMLAKYNSAVFVNDEKTSGSLGSYWANSWRLASQMTGYIWAAKSFGYNVQGAVIRGVSPLKERINHLMIIEQRPQWMIDRWEAQLRKDIDRMIACWEEGVWDYDLDGACGSYGGCDYLTLCTSQTPEKWFNSDYCVFHWDPLDKTD